jgi:uncharacterized protein (TIGR03437 family)
MRALYSIAALLLISSPTQAQTAPVISASPPSLTFTFAQGGSLPGKQTIALTASVAPATYTLAFATTSGGNWINVTPTSGTITGTTPTVLTVQIDPFSAGLAPGSYAGTITVNQSFRIPLSLTVTTALLPSPTSLAFTTQLGPTGSPTPAPPAQTLNVASGGQASFAASATSAGNWLAVSPASGTTPQNLTVTVNPAGLAAGTFSGSITLTSPATPTVTVAVTLTIQPPLMFTLSPAALNFQATSAVPQPPSQTVSVFSNFPATVFATATTTSGNPWLTVTQSATQTPLSLTITVAGGLAVGPHIGQILLSTTRGGATVATIPINYNVAAAQTPTLQVSPDTLSFSSAQGGLPIQQALAVSNTGSGVLNFGAQITAQSGGNWLALQSTTGTATAGSPATVPFTITPGTLRPGAYSATVTVTSGTGADAQTATGLIVLSISSQAPSLLLSQTGVAFTAVAQGSNPPAQTVSVVNAGSGSLSWNVAVSTLAGDNWLSATPTSGSTQPLPVVAPTISISVNSQTLAAGTYYGSVKVNSQVISVQTTVLPVGQPPSPSLSTNGLVFTGVAGSTPPAAQAVPITNALAYSSTISTDDGGNWLTAIPAATTISVQAAVTTLTAGIRHGTIRLGFTDGSVQTINVLAVTAPAGTPASAARSSISGLIPAASGGCPSVLVPQITSLPTSFTVTASQSVPISVTVVDDCGHSLANSSSSSVIASFFDASKPPGPSAKLQGDVKLTPQGNGMWSGTWTPPAAVAQAQIIVVALGINGTTPFAGQSLVNGTVRTAGANAPALSLGIFNAASYQPGNTIALGSFVSIFGANLSNGSGAPGTQPLPTNYQGTQVFLGGVALPLQFAGPNQINALIPGNVAVDSQQPLVIQRDLTQGAPVSVTIADAQPGIYTANQQGTGQGAVLTSDNVLDAPTGGYPGSHPATRGDVIQIFCTGLGAVNNPPPAGAAAPNSPLSTTVGTVTATIAGNNAQVLFSGLAPGFIGLYQVNVLVPLGAPAAGAVPLVLTVGSAVSNTATIAIQ